MNLDMGHCIFSKYMPSFLDTLHSLHILVDNSVDVQCNRLNKNRLAFRLNHDIENAVHTDLVNKY